MADPLITFHEHDYYRFFEAIGEDLELPETFEAHRQQIAERRANAAAQGVVLEEFVTDYEAFAAFCGDRGQPENSVMFAGYVIAGTDPNAPKGRHVDDTRRKARHFLNKRR